MNKQLVEIERRWLLSNNPIHTFVDTYENKVTIKQRYLEDGSRLRNIQHEDLTTTWEHIIKTKQENGSNVEVILDLSKSDIIEKLKTVNSSIDKIRYNKDGWEIDVFTNKKLVIAEYEMQSIDQEVIIPDWLQPYIIMEITEFKEFSNYNLSNLR